jgi:exosortase B
MSTVLEERSLPDAARPGWGPWAAVLLGLALLYVPTYMDLAKGLWRDDAYAHGPIIVAVFAWLVWRRRDALLDEAAAPAPLAGAACLAFGLALYLLGRTLSLTVFEVASHIPVIAGALLVLRGREGVRRFAFPLFFLLFLVPLPGFVLDSVTAPLKGMVSASVEALLLALGYPVAREGVVLSVGDHRMLVADACSGLNSIYSLLAMGLLYTHVTGRQSAARTVLVVLGIVPIAVAANILRVLALVLVTYHFGDEAGQGFLHGFAGMLVFVAALAMLIGYDALLRRVLRMDTTLSPALSPTLSQGRGRFSLPAVLAGIAMAATAAAAPALKPVPDSKPAADLEVLVPAVFGDWRIDPEMIPLTPAPDVQSKLDRIYRQIVSRTYVNSGGERMMLTVAYGGDQSDALKAHRQEVCYAAQGFEIRELRHGSVSAAGRTIPVTRMLAVRGERSEPVTYWFTMGDRVVLGRLERLEVQVRNGLAGRVPDGMLVRVSSLSADSAAAFAAQQSFIASILAAIPAADATRFVGALHS